MAVKINKGDSLGLLNLTPIIDVVFNLLIFFLVATQFADEDKKLEMPIPQASQAEAMTESAMHLVINIDERGAFYVGRNPVDERGLYAALRQAAVNNPVRQIVQIRSHARAPAQAVVTVADNCIKAGLRKYQLITLDPRNKNG